MSSFPYKDGVELGGVWTFQDSSHMSPTPSEVICALCCLLFKCFCLFVFKNNIDVCPECGHLKQKHILCGYCYEKVRKETAEIRRQMGKQEGGPFRAPTTETVVLYSGETPSEQDQGKRIIERERKRPSWFTQNWHQPCFKRITSHKTLLPKKKKKDSLLVMRFSWLFFIFMLVFKSSI